MRASVAADPPVIAAGPRRALPFEEEGLTFALPGVLRRDEAFVSPPSAIGESPAWLAAMEDLRAAALAPRTPVLVTGESGSGKELAASQIHAWSPRASRPFVSVNAACFSPSLLESELFGHEAGAFTGATSRKAGLFELASGGTLFLDEIGEPPLELQPKLLRVLEGHPFRRVGGERAITADVRVVSATNSQMQQAVERGRFRLDLYHRLRVVEVTLPPLRDRGDDADLLAIHFVSTLALDLGKPALGIAPEALAAIRAHTWPGNVRELRNAIEHAVVLCKGDRIALHDLPRDVVRAAAAVCPPPSSRERPTLRSAPQTPRSSLSRRGLDDVVRQHVLEVFRECEGNLAKAARALGIGRATLRRRLRDYGVTPADPAPHRRA